MTTEERTREPRLSFCFGGYSTAEDETEDRDQHARALQRTRHDDSPFFCGHAWFRGEAEIATFALDELLGTKLRALYQRKKGRDLFDIWHALGAGRATSAAMITCFRRYMAEGGHGATRAQFEENLAGKRMSHAFREDTGPLLRPGITWDLDAAMDTVLDNVIRRLPGAPWKGGAVG